MPDFNIAKAGAAVLGQPGQRSRNLWGRAAEREGAQPGAAAPAGDQAGASPSFGVPKPPSTTDNIQRQTQGIAQQSQFQATTQDFDEAGGVAGRVAKLTASDSPLMEAARTRAAQAAASRGIGGSSMAIQAGEQAMIETAAPIAQADASLYSQQRLANQTALNQAAQTNAQLRTNVLTTGMQLGESARQADQTHALDRDKLTESGRQFDANLSLEGDKLDQASRQFAQQMGLEYDKLTQAEQQQLRQLAESKRQADQSNTLEKDKLTESGRQFDANLGLQQQKLEQDAAQFAKSMGLEYDKLAESDKQQLRQLAMEQSRLNESTRQFDTGQKLEQAKLSESQRQFDTNQADANSRFSQELAEKARQFDTSESGQNARQSADLMSRAKLAELDAQTRLTVANLDASSRESVAKMENDWRLELSRNERIAGAWGTMMERIGTIQNNKDLDAGTKSQLIQQNMDLFAGFAEFSKKLGDSPIDVSDLLDFTTGSAAAPAPSPSPSGGGSSDGGGYQPYPGYEPWNTMDRGG